jgi:hypothetical protein
MAAMESIDQARNVLEEKMLDLVMIVKTCDAVAGDNPPDWLAMMFGRVLELDRAADAYMMAVHHHARPVLADMAKLTRQ